MHHLGCPASGISGKEKLDLGHNTRLQNHQKRVGRRDEKLRAECNGGYGGKSAMNDRVGRAGRWSWLGGVVWAGAEGGGGRSLVETVDSGATQAPTPLYRSRQKLPTLNILTTRLRHIVKYPQEL